MKTVKKAFLDYEKEEKWLNEMCAEGWALVGHAGWRYDFQECEPGQYISRIELLKEPVNKSIDYVQFMQDLGAEMVTHTGNWTYFRKKAEDGSFNIYSDMDSRLSHYRMLNAIWTAIACGELGTALLLFYYAIFPLPVTFGYSFFVNAVFGGLLVIASLFFIAWGHIYRKKISRLKKEKRIRE